MKFLAVMMILDIVVCAVEALIFYTPRKGR